MSAVPLHILSVIILLISADTCILVCLPTGTFQISDQRQFEWSWTEIVARARFFNIW